MSDETDGLTIDEQAYFDSAGEKTKADPKPAADGAPETVEQGSDPALQQEATPEAGADEQGDQKGEKVPLAVLLEERKAAKEDRRRLQELQRQHDKMEQRWREIDAAAERYQAEQQKGPEDPEPDPNVDIFAHQAWVGRQIAKQQAAEQQRQVEAQEQQRQTQLDGAINEYWNVSAAEHKAANPDFDEASNFLARTRDQQLAAMGSIYPALATPQGRQQYMVQELKQIIAAAARQGVSPAQAVHQMARQWGFKATPKQNQAVEQVQALAEAVEGSKSLSSVGGGRGAGETTAESLGNMSDEAFEKWLEKNGSKGFRRIAGG